MAEKVNKKSVKKNDVSKKTAKDNSKKKNTSEKKSLWAKFMTFCNGVKSEFDKIHWPNKSDMLKYSIATIVFIVFLALFFYLIDVIFALIQTLFK